MPTDPLDSLFSSALPSVFRLIRKRLLNALSAERGRRRNLTWIIQREVERFEPVLARTLKDAQILSFLTAAKRTVKELPIPVSSLRPFGAIPPDPPRGTFFLARPDEPPPLIRFPQIEQAARWLHSRIDFTQDELRDREDDARTVAFTVARVQTTDAIRRVREAVTEDVVRGGTLRDFRARVGDVLEESGLSDAQGEAIYRTHVARAYSAGQIDVLDHPLVSDEFPYLLYSATHDGRVRPEHLAMEKLGLNGTAVYRRDDPVWELFYPPWGWQCRCIVIPLSIEDAAARGVREARLWVKTGKPPAVPEHVEPPPFTIPKGWIPTGKRLAAVA